MACSHFLEFQPIERPSWRMIKDRNDTIPKISEMITQILEYENTWRRKENTTQCSAVKKEMHLEFLYQIQIGEEIGVDDRDNSDDIINNEENKANRKRGTKQQQTDPEIALKKRRLSCDHLKSNNTDSQKFEDGNKSSQCSLPSSLDAEDYLNEGNTDTIPAKKTETINLLRGYRHLRNELKQIPKEERSSYLGLIDVEVCIKKCHEILMKDVMDKDSTVPGKFSVLRRATQFNGKTYHYPYYKTEDIAEDAIQAIVDQYNKMLDEISNGKSEKKKTGKLL